MQDWHVGQKIACIRECDDTHVLPLFYELPQVGRTYTIRGIETQFEELSFYLEEIILPSNIQLNEFSMIKGEPSFFASFFRPLTKQKQQETVSTRLSLDELV